MFLHLVLKPLGTSRRKGMVELLVVMALAAVIAFVIANRYQQMKRLSKAKNPAQLFNTESYDERLRASLEIIRNYVDALKIVVKKASNGLPNADWANGFGGPEDAQIFESDNFLQDTTMPWVILAIGPNDDERPVVYFEEFLTIEGRDFVNVRAKIIDAKGAIHERTRRITIPLFTNQNELEFDYVECQNRCGGFDCDRWKVQKTDGTFKGARISPINTVLDFMRMKSNGVYRLERDLDFSNLSDDLDKNGKPGPFHPDGNLTNIYFDGNGKTISGFNTLNHNHGYFGCKEGIFVNMTGSVIYNLKIVNAISKDGNPVLLNQAACLDKVTGTGLQGFTVGGSDKVYNSKFEITIRADSTQTSVAPLAANEFKNVEMDANIILEPDASPDYATSGPNSGGIAGLSIRANKVENTKVRLKVEGTSAKRFAHLAGLIAYSGYQNTPTDELLIKNTRVDMDLSNYSGKVGGLAAGLVGEVEGNGQIINAGANVKGKLSAKDGAGGFIGTISGNVNISESYAILTDPVGGYSIQVSSVPGVGGGLYGAGGFIGTTGENASNINISDSFADIAGKVEAIISAGMSSWARQAGFIGSCSATRIIRSYSVAEVAQTTTPAYAFQGTNAISGFPVTCITDITSFYDNDQLSPLKNAVGTNAKPLLRTNMRGGPGPLNPFMEAPALWSTTIWAFGVSGNFPRLINTP